MKPASKPAAAKAQPAGARSARPAGRPAATPGAAAQPKPAAAAGGLAPGATPAYLQAKLAVSQPRDAAEQEADQTARALVQDLQPGAVPQPLQAGAPTRLFRQARPAAPVANVVQTPAAQNSPAKTPTAQTSAATPPPAQPRDAPAAVEQQVADRRARSAGQAMPPALQHSLGQRLGADLSAVRLHNDADAAALCAQMQARAFTVGSDIYFAAGAYDPTSAAGVELIAHELTHVLQQGAAATVPADAPQALQRDGFWDWLGGDDAPSDPLADCRNKLVAADAWAAAGPYPATPRTLIGAAGRGGFDAQYLAEPSTGLGTLQISQGVAVSFNDTLVRNAGVVQRHPDLPDTPAIRARAAQIQAMPAARRATQLARYQWTAAEHQPWMDLAEATVQSTWSRQHSFFLNRPQWNWLGASVNLDIQVRDGAQRATDHMTLRTYKLPPAGSLSSDFGIDNEVQPGAADNARDQVMQVGSPTLEPNSYDLLRRSVSFGIGQSALTQAITDELDIWVLRYNGAPGHVAHQAARIELVGHTSAAGTEADNLALATARANAVQTYLQANGFTNAVARTEVLPRGEAEADQRHPHRRGDQRVDIVVDGGPRQRTINHEFGHALGLGDEYGSGGVGGTAGTLAGHDAMVRDMTNADGSHLPGAVKERNGGIMAAGNEVRPQHYAVFHHALADVTGQSPWALGITVPKWRVQLDCGVPALLNDRPPAPAADPAANPAGNPAGGGDVLV